MIPAALIAKFLLVKGSVGPFFKGLLDFLKSPLGILTMIVLAYFVGTWRGGNQAEERCRVEKQQSIDAARKVDVEAARAREEAMTRQVSAASDRAIAAEARLKEMQDAQRPDDRCIADDDDTERLRRSDRVPGGGANPPRPPKRDPGSGAPTVLPKRR